MGVLRVVAVLAVVAVMVGLTPMASASAASVSAAVPETPVACGSAPAARLSGMFVRPGVGATSGEVWWSEATWKTELAELRGLCVNDVVVQWTAQSWVGPNPPAGVTAEPALRCVGSDAQGRFVQPLFPTGVAAWDQARLCHTSGATVTADKRPDQVRGALVGAKAVGSRVWLGLQIAETGWFRNGGANSDAWMTQQTQISQELVRQLWSRYGAEFRDQIAGFYLPFEFSTTQFEHDGAGRERYLKWVRGVTQTVEQVAPSLQTMVSPFIWASIGTDPAVRAQRDARAAYTGMVRDITAAGVDVVALQDAVGARTAAAVDVAPWFLATSDGLSGSAQLWANVEQYNTLGLHAFPVRDLVSHITAVSQAVAAEGNRKAVVSKTIGFSQQSITNQSTYYRSNVALRSAYRQYLSGQDTRQTVPAVGSDTQSGQSTVTAAVVSGSMDATIQWPMLTASAPSRASGVPVPVFGYEIFRNGVAIGQVPQPVDKNSNLAASGYPAPSTTNASPPQKPGVLTFTDLSVQAGQQLSCEVAAVDAFGNRSPRVGVSLTTPTSATYVVSNSGNKGIDLAVNAPYTYTTAPDNGYPDADAVSKLTDGVLGEPTLNDPAWAGTNTSTTITLTLPHQMNVHAIRSHWLRQTAAAIDYPRTLAAHTCATPTSVGAIPGTAFTDPLTSPTTTTAPGALTSAPTTGWMQSVLTAGQTRPVHTIELTATTEAEWAFLSEIVLIDGSGTPLPLTGATVSMRNTSPAYTDTRRNKLTTPTAPTPLIHHSELTPGTGVGWHNVSQPVITLDLGQARPIGTVETHWWNKVEWGAYAPGAPQISVSTDNQTYTSLPAPTTTDTDVIRTYTSDAPGASARYVRISAPANGAWVIAASLHVYTPTATDLATHQTPATYRTASSTNPDYRTDISKSPSNWPTVAGSRTPPLNDPAMGGPTACTAVNEAPCRTATAAGLSILTATTANQAPVPLTRPEDSASTNFVSLRTSPGWDITVPLASVNNAPTTRIEDAAITVAHKPEWGIILPTSIDLYTTATTGGTDITKTWTWTGHTAEPPRQPPYQPADASYLYTFTFRNITTPAGATKIRYHLNTTSNSQQHTYIARTQAAIWK